MSPLSLIQFRYLTQIFIIHTAIYAKYLTYTSSFLYDSVNCANNTIEARWKEH